MFGAHDERTHDQETETTVSRATMLETTPTRLLLDSTVRRARYEWL